jgi:hypothetical protein
MHYGYIKATEAFSKSRQMPAKVPLMSEMSETRRAIHGSAGPRPLLVVALAVFLVLGCVGQGQGTQAPSGGATMSAGGGSAGAAASKNDSLMTENKTGYQQTQDTIASVVPDGTYKTETVYYNHAGPVTLDISVTVKDDVVTAASVAGVDPDPMSAHYISSLNGALPDLVVGKKITELSIPHNVAGSSLTTAAFRTYVEGLAQNGGQ